MGRRPLKRTTKLPPSRRHPSSPSPDSEPQDQRPSTPRRSFPLNSTLRSLSTPLRPPSHHPFLRAFSTPSFRRSEYSPQVRRLCQQDAYKRLPFDNALYVKNKLICSRCGKTGTFTQNLVFKQGHAGEWVRACNNPHCELVYYPAQPGTPPDLLLRIEAAREMTASSLTMLTPDSKSSHSRSLSTGSRSQERDIVSSIGGELEDWLFPIFHGLDMESVARASVNSDSPSPQPVAGPSTGLGLRAVLGTPPQCARDEEIARALQAAVDEEDASILQQLQDEPLPEAPLKHADRHQATTTLSSLSAELAALTQSRPLQAEPEASAVHTCPSAPGVSTPSRDSSPESSPSPRPRKKKRILPPPIPRKFRGPLPPALKTKPSAKANTSTGTTEVAHPGASVSNVETRSKRLIKLPAKTSRADATPSLLARAEARLPVVIIISSDDESDHGFGSRRSRPARMPRTRSEPDGDQSGTISITSSDSDSPSLPPASQPHPAPSRVVNSKRHVPSRTITATTHASEPENARSAAQHHLPGLRATTESRAPPRDLAVTMCPSHPNPNPERALSIVQPWNSRPRGAWWTRVLSPEIAATTPLTYSASDTEDAPPATQPRVSRPHMTIRSRAPSREIEAAMQMAHNSSGPEDSTPPVTQPQTIHSRAPDVPVPTRPAMITSNDSDEEGKDSVLTGSSNKENNAEPVLVSCLDETIALRLAGRQALARRRAPVFASIARSSSPSSSSSSSSSSKESDSDAQDASTPSDRPPPDPQSSSGNAGDRVDASDVFGDPFRFELYPTVPELAKITNPEVAKRHWVLMVKIWYKNKVPPSTKMIPLEDSSCCIRLSDFFIVARAFQFTGVTSCRIWNRFTTDWDSRSLYEYISVSIADNHTLLIRLPTVATLSSWAENVSQAYGSCQTVDPRPIPTRKGKELQYN